MLKKYYLSNYLHSMTCSSLSHLSHSQSILKILNFHYDTMICDVYVVKTSVACDVNPALASSPWTLSSPTWSVAGFSGFFQLLVCNQPGPTLVGVLTTESSSSQSFLATHPPFCCELSSKLVIFLLQLSLPPFRLNP